MEWWEIVSRTVASEFSDIPDLEHLIRVSMRLLLAAALGGILGYEREYKGKAAGLRTHMLVALGAALFVLVPVYVIRKNRADDSYLNDLIGDRDESASAVEAPKVAG